MPTNVTPQYAKAEEKYHQAQTISEKIKALENLIREAPGHKGAENLRAELRTKLAKLKEQLEREQKSAGGRSTYTLKKEGAATISIIGVTNSGKSTLLAQVTNATPKIAPYAYTTTQLEIGTFEYHGIKFQFVEIPAISENFLQKENGPALMSIVRTTDLVILLVRSKAEETLLKEELKAASIIINKPRPPVKIKKTSGGGIEIVGTIKGSKEEILAILKSHNIYNCILEAKGSVTLEELESAINERTKFLPSISILNHGQTYNKDAIGKKLLEKLHIMKVYTKQPRKDKDFPPIPLKSGTNIQELGEKIHKDFIKKFKFARVWGKSAKHQGMKTGLEHTLEDGDVVEFHIG